MSSFIVDLLVNFAKTLEVKCIDNLIERWEGGKPIFTKVKADIYYSLYVGQNHVSEGGQMKIYKAGAAFTVFNPGKAARVLRELTLYCQVDGVEHPFHLHDSHLDDWEENYQLPSKHVSAFSWQAAPEGYGLTDGCGSDGIIPIQNLDTISSSFTYKDEHGRPQKVPVGSTHTFRLPKEQIAE